VIKVQKNTVEKVRFLRSAWSSGLIRSPMEKSEGWEW